jgi:hypothetical protein
MTVMSTPVAYIVGALATVTLVWSLVLLVANRSLTDSLFWGLALVEVALLIQSVAGFVALGMTNRPVDGATFGAYLVTIVLVLPAATLWGVSDKTRWGTGVLAVGCFTVVVLLARLVQIWGVGSA